MSDILKNFLANPLGQFSQGVSIMQALRNARLNREKHALDLRQADQRDKQIEQNAADYDLTSQRDFHNRNFKTAEEGRLQQAQGYKMERDRTEYDRLVKQAELEARKKAHQDLGTYGVGLRLGPDSEPYGKTFRRGSDGQTIETPAFRGPSSPEEFMERQKRRDLESVRQTTKKAYAKENASVWGHGQRSDITTGEIKERRNIPQVMTQGAAGKFLLDLSRDEEGNLPKEDPALLALKKAAEEVSVPQHAAQQKVKLKNSFMNDKLFLNTPPVLLKAEPYKSKLKAIPPDEMSDDLVRYLHSQGIEF